MQTTTHAPATAFGVNAESGRLLAATADGLSRCRASGVGRRWWPTTVRSCWRERDRPRLCTRAMADEQGRQACADEPLATDPGLIPTPAAAREKSGGVESVTPLPARQGGHGMRVPGLLQGGSACALAPCERGC